MKSVIHTSECVSNRKRRFGADPHYYPARVEFAFTSQRALFTEEQLLAAIERAKANAEDWPQVKAGWWQRAKAWLGGA